MIVVVPVRTIVVLYKLVACHMVGDYVFQTDYIAKTKAENPWHLLVHCVLYTVPFAISIGIGWHIPWLFLTHLCIDLLRTRGFVATYWVDQMLHITMLGPVLIMTGCV